MFATCTLSKGETFCFILSSAVFLLPSPPCEKSAIKYEWKIQKLCDARPLKIQPKTRDKHKKREGGWGKCMKLLWQSQIHLVFVQHIDTVGKVCNCIWSDTIENWFRNACAEGMKIHITNWGFVNYCISFIMLHAHTILCRPPPPSTPKNAYCFCQFLVCARDHNVYLYFGLGHTLTPDSGVLECWCVYESHLKNMFNEF